MEKLKNLLENLIMQENEQDNKIAELEARIINIDSERQKALDELDRVVEEEAKDPSLAWKQEDVTRARSNIKTRFSQEESSLKKQLEELRERKVKDSRDRKKRIIEEIEKQKLYIADKIQNATLVINNSTSTILTNTSNTIANLEKRKGELEEQLNKSNRRIEDLSTRIKNSESDGKTPLEIIEKWNRDLEALKIRHVELEKEIGYQIDKITKRQKVLEKNKEKSEAFAKIQGDRVEQYWRPKFQSITDFIRDVRDSDISNQQIYQHFFGKTFQPENGDTDILERNVEEQVTDGIEESAEEIPTVEGTIPEVEGETTEEKIEAQVTEVIDEPAEEKRKVAGTIPEEKVEVIDYETKNKFMRFVLEQMDFNNFQGSEQAKETHILEWIKLPEVDEWIKEYKVYIDEQRPIDSKFADMIKKNFDCMIFGFKIDELKKELMQIMGEAFEEEIEKYVTKYSKLFDQTILKEEMKIRYRFAKNMESRDKNAIIEGLAELYYIGYACVKLYHERGVIEIPNDLECRNKLKELYRKRLEAIRDGKEVDKVDAELLDYYDQYMNGLRQPSISDNGIGDLDLPKNFEEELEAVEEQTETEQPEQLVRPVNASTTNVPPTNTASVNTTVTNSQPLNEINTTNNEEQKFSYEFSMKGIKYNNEDIDLVALLDWQDEYQEDIEDAIQDVLGHEKKFNEFLMFADKLIYSSVVFKDSQRKNDGKLVINEQGKQILQEYYKIWSNPLSQENSNMDITYDLRGMSKISRFFNINKFTDSEIYNIKDNAYELRKRENVHIEGRWAKLQFKIREGIERLKIKWLGDGRNEVEVTEQTVNSHNDFVNRLNPNTPEYTQAIDQEKRAENITLVKENEER